MSRLFPPMHDHVILVSPSDEQIGTLEKMAAHREGLLHRAVSVVVIDEDGRVLLQRRASGKYHSPLLWANACCTHPRPDEGVQEAARRRLREEMGIDCDVEPLFTFTYRAELGAGLVEHEFDHVFLARWSGSPDPDAAEVSEWRWVSPAELRDELESEPQRFTSWASAVMLGVLDHAERAHLERTAHER